MSLRLRILRRLTSVEDASDFESFFATEFHRNAVPETDLSVFDIDAPTLVQTHAECAASWLDSPPRHRGGVAVDACEGAFTARHTPGKTDFEYTKRRHVDLNFLDVAELRAFAQLVLNLGRDGDRPASAVEVRTYGRKRLDASDPEWQSVTARKKKWAKELAKPSE